MTCCWALGRRLKRSSSRVNSTRSRRHRVRMAARNCAGPPISGRCASVDYRIIYYVDDRTQGIEVRAIRDRKDDACG